MITSKSDQLYCPTETDKQSNIKGGQHGKIVSILASGPSCPRFSILEIVTVAGVNQCRCLEGSGLKMLIKPI